MENLFTNGAEYLAFLKIIANRRLNNLLRDNDTFLHEIEEALIKCGEICSAYGADTNYIRDIYELESKIAIAERKNITSTDVGDLSMKRESLTNKYNSFVATLPLEEAENLEFYFKQISDRSSRISKNNEAINKINQEYPDARTITPEDRKNHRIFREINNYLHPKTETEEIVAQEEESLPYVVEMHEAPTDLVEEEIVETPEVDLGPSVADNSFFKNDEADDFGTQIESEPVIHKFKEVEEREVDAMPETPKEDEVTFSLERGTSLTDLSVALCGDENGWYDIYNANKEIIDQRLEEAGLSRNEAFESNDEVFDGLTLVIPNIYEKSSTPKSLTA